MENTLYIATSRQTALMKSMDIVANNIANMNTHGYRAQNTIFQEMIEDPVGNKDPLSFVIDYGQYDNTAPGPMTQTGAPLDVALVGDGFFSIEGPDGQTRYTRNGSFTRSTDGELVTQQGYRVLGGGAISIPSEAKQIIITEGGQIKTESGTIGQLDIVEFESPQDLKPYGNGMYESDTPGRPPQNTKAQQGALEGSNVNAVVEMTRMIDIQRSYQSIQRMAENEHDRIRTTIRKLSETS